MNLAGHMKFHAKSFAFASLFASALASVFAAETEAMPLARLMVEIVNPAANTLWGAQSEAALSNDDWDKISRAITALRAASATVREGGASPKQKALAKSPQWQAWSQRFASTLELARGAGTRKDRQALNEAGKALVDICQGCHLSVALVPTGS